MGKYDKIKNWKASLQGKFGRFDLGNELSVEYVQTGLDIDVIGKVDPVRRIMKRNELKFETLLQRDLDDERINDDLIPYLSEKKRIRFFPAMTIVVISKSNNSNKETEIIDHYPPLKEEIKDVTIDNEKHKKWIREYGKLLRIEIFVDDCVNKVGDINDENIDYEGSTIHVSDDATLLAIDGQHRLIALQGIMGKLPDDEKALYSNLSSIEYNEYSRNIVPATVIYIPSLHKGNDNKDINLVEAFRQIFVDINRNAREVNESRNILLDEHDLNSIFTRHICSHIQDHGDNDNIINLDNIEWDKVEKEHQLTRIVASTNVLFLKEVLSDWLGGDDDGSKLRVNLTLNTLRNKLDDDLVKYEEIKSKNVSYKQKKIIVDHFQKNYLVPIVKLLSHIPFVLERKAKIIGIKKQLNQPSSMPQDNSIKKRTADVLFEGPEKQKNILDPLVKAKYQETCKELEQFDLERDNNERGTSLVRTKLFQRAYFETIFEDIFKSETIDPELSFVEFVDKLCPCIKSITENGWKKYFGGDAGKKSVIINWGLYNGFSTVPWKIEYVSALIYLLMMRPALNFVDDSDKITNMLEEKKNAILKKIDSNIKKEIDSKEITDEKKTDLLQNAGEEIANIMKYE